MNIDEAMKVCCLITNMPTIPKRIRDATSIVLQELGKIRHHVEIERPERHYGKLYCPECGNEVSHDVDANVCHRCGKKLDWTLIK